jgi:hypothetical protein
MSTHLVFFDSHAHHNHNNDRALWLGELINELRPDVVIDGGDTADLPSLASYDKGTRAAVGRTYQKDIAAHADFQDKLWNRIRRAKKKLPRRIRLIGNHEQRIDRALDSNQALVGSIGYGDLDLERYYDEVVYYDGQLPGVILVDGIHYSHYFGSGLMGRPVSGEHPAYSLLSKKHVSCTQGHSHIFDHCVRATGDGNKIAGLVANCFIDYEMDWPGQTQKMWTSGVHIKSNVENGMYDLSTISMKTLKERYG